MNLESKEAIHDKIFELFQKMGGKLPIRDLATEAIADGIWDESQLAGATIVWASKVCRDALQKKGDDGLPKAVPVEKGQHPVWQQFELLTLDEATFVLRVRVEQLGALHHEIVTLHEHFVRKFGGGIPSIPRLM